MQPLFLQGPSITLRAMLLLMASVMVMVADHRWHHLEAVRGVLESYVIYPLRYTINLPVDFIRWADHGLSSHEFLLQENTQLKEQQLRAQVSLQKLSVLERENDRLREMLGAQPKVGERMLVAELLVIDLDPNRQQVVINKGAEQGVYQGQPLIDAWGVMGQVVHVADTSATAMLISDPNHAIPVQINRNDLRSTAFGLGYGGRLELRHIPHNADIELGDLLVTSGLGGRFPANYPVGRIVEIERAVGETFARVVAEPVAHLDRSREVLLIWHNEAEMVKTEAIPVPEAAVDAGK
jgi:rod shape-determining protein MreC